MPKAPPVFRPRRDVKFDLYKKKNKSRRYDKKRGTAHQRGYGTEWRKARLEFLFNNPLCVQHLEQGISISANEVDHVIPHKGDQELFWDKNNWQALCKSCHSRKTATEDSSFARQRTLI